MERYMEGNEREIDPKVDTELIASLNAGLDARFNAPKYCSYCGSEDIRYELKKRRERDKIEPVAFWAEVSFYAVDCGNCKLKYRIEPVGLSRPEGSKLDLQAQD